MVAVLATSHAVALFLIEPAPHAMERCVREPEVHALEHDRARLADIESLGAALLSWLGSAIRLSGPRPEFVLGGHWVYEGASDVRLPNGATTHFGAGTAPSRRAEPRPGIRLIVRAVP